MLYKVYKKYINNQNNSILSFIYYIFIYTCISKAIYYCIMSTYYFNLKYEHNFIGILIIIIPSDLLNYSKV